MLLFIVSGIFKIKNPPEDHIEYNITKQCNAQVGIGAPYTEIDYYCSGPIITNESCCYCYDEYPNFLNDSDIWEYHRHHINKELQGYHKQKQTTEGDDDIIRYWFCAEQRDIQLQQDIHLNIPNNNKLIILSGKWAYKAKFKKEVQGFCNALKGFVVLQKGNIINQCYYDDPAYILNDKRFHRHLFYCNNASDATARGGGYWFHKIVILYHHMMEHHDNDIFVWNDLDRIDFFRQGSFNGLIDIMDQRNADMIIETHVYMEHHWTKEDIFSAFNATDDMRNSKQTNANAMIVRNNQQMRSFFYAVIECLSDYHMLSDEDSYIPNGPIYQENRHDQSILSLMIKKFLTNHNKKVIGPPVQIFTPIYSAYHSYKFDQQQEQPYCPFESFYKANPNFPKNSIGVMKNLVSILHSIYIVPSFIL